MKKDNLYEQTDLNPTGTEPTLPNIMQKSQIPSYQLPYGSTRQSASFLTALELITYTYDTKSFELKDSLQNRMQHGLTARFIFSYKGFSRSILRTSGVDIEAVALDT